MERIVRVDTGNSRTNGTQKSKKKHWIHELARGVFSFFSFPTFFLLLFLGKMDGSNEVNE
jgi:hypothetical protein